MHLTRFRFNTLRPGSRKLLSSPQAMHAAVLGGFPELLPGDPVGEPGGPRVLWRVDRNAKAEVFLYVVSPERPELTHLVEQAGWPKADPDTWWRTHDYAGFLSRLKVGQTWAFRPSSPRTSPLATRRDGCSRSRSDAGSRWCAARTRTQPCPTSMATS